MWARKQLKRKAFSMGSVDQVDVWMGSNADDAEFDYKTVKRQHKDEKLGSYEYAAVAKNGEGNVHVHMHEKPVQHGTWWGIAAAARERTKHDDRFEFDTQRHTTHG